MNLVPTGNLGNCLVAAQRFQRHPAFEFAVVTLLPLSALSIVKYTGRFTPMQVAQLSGRSAAAHIAPVGTLCLQSALRFHKLLDEEPEEICIAMPRKCSKPKMFLLPVRYFTFSRQTLSAGEVYHKIHETNVYVHSIEKAIVDCFRLPGKGDHDLAVTVLRRAAEQKLINYDDMWELAGICDCKSQIRPYIEALNGPIRERPEKQRRDAGAHRFMMMVLAAIEHDNSKTGEA